MVEGQVDDLIRDVDYLTYSTGSPLLMKILIMNLQRYEQTYLYCFSLTFPR